MIDICIEIDSFGLFEVLFDKFWGVQMQCLIMNFLIGWECQLVLVICVFGIIKQVVVQVNMVIGNLDVMLGNVMVQVVSEVVVGKFDDNFLLVVWQIGFGMQLNMNVNEVILNCVIQILGGEMGLKKFVYFNDYVNMGQLLNDIFLIVMYVVIVMYVCDLLILGLEKLYKVLVVKFEEFKDIIKIGCIYMQDVMLLILGQEFGGYVYQVVKGIECVKLVLGDIYELVQGGIVVGIGLNIKKGWDMVIVVEIVKIIGLLFVIVLNKFEVLVVYDVMVFFFGVLKIVVGLLFKIVNDMCLLGFGLWFGLGELILLENEFGFLIMLGKVNLMQVEVLIMVCVYVMGNDVVIGFVGLQGYFELNVYNLMMFYNVL